MPEATLPASRHVFVYGTLRRGGDNDITRLQPAPRFIGTGSIPGAMYHFGRYPGVLLGREGSVLGEVYAITPELEQTLDEIEELYPQQTNEYFKRDIKVRVGDEEIACIVYEINPSYVDGKPLIASGDWVKDCLA
ncbi:MAG: gamma-glutamylcyclotransferase family protein [Burkholderiaceae bacterium]